MQQDAWRTYLELALGLTERPRKRAKQVIDSVAAQSGASVDQLRSMTEELVQTSLSNRESILQLVHAELERALGAMGLANAEQLVALRTEVRDLEERLERVEAGAGGAPRSTTGKSAAKKAAPAGRKTATAPSSRPAAKKAATAGKKAQPKPTAKKAGARKATAKKAAAKKSGAGPAGGSAGR